MLLTPRLRLCHWREAHRDPFAQMNADPSVSWDLGGPLLPAKSDVKFERYRAAWHDHGIGRWAIEQMDGRFLGYVGISFRADRDHPLGPHHEIGWRLVRDAWGQGYASEGARAALDHGFEEAGVDRILAYTSPDNVRSQAVMERLRLDRASHLDFETAYPKQRRWCGLVWIALSSPRSSQA